MEKRSRKDGIGTVSWFKNWDINFWKTVKGHDEISVSAGLAFSGDFD